MLYIKERCERSSRSLYSKTEMSVLQRRNAHRARVALACTVWLCADIVVAQPPGGGGGGGPGSSSYTYDGMCESSITSCCSGTETVIVVPTSVTLIATKAFYGCTTIDTIEWRHSSDDPWSTPALTAIGMEAFDGCTSLGIVDLSELSKLTTLHDKAFSSTSITHITLAPGITSIGSDAFTGGSLDDPASVNFNGVDCALATNGSTNPAFEFTCATATVTYTSTSVACTVSANSCSSHPIDGPFDDCTNSCCPSPNGPTTIVIDSTVVYVRESEFRYCMTVRCVRARSPESAQLSVHPGCCTLYFLLSILTTTVFLSFTCSFSSSYSSSVHL